MSNIYQWVCYGRVLGVIKSKHGTVVEALKIKWVKIKAIFREQSVKL